MKTRKSTSGLIVSFFFAAAMVVTLHSPADTAEITLISNTNDLSHPDLRADNSAKKRQGKCGHCSWIQDGDY
ncbi:MAG: hypothetical protein D3903_12140 [Candidatus Electrothrix sp. GM3_4]|nr:hypothetical protein [Candidatus Electrothrix sp. GM3_4]